MLKLARQQKKHFPKKELVVKFRAAGIAFLSIRIAKLMMRSFTTLIRSVVAHRISSTKLTPSCIV